MTIYIVRHGEPAGTEYGKRYLGLTDAALSDKGREQAEILGAKLAELGAGCDVKIVTSPLRRCLETAEIIKERLGCRSAETDEDLIEIDMGAWDGMYFDEVRAKYPEEFVARGRDLWNYRTPGGESFAQTGEKFSSAIGRIMESSPENDTVIVVTHAGAARAGLSLITDITFDEWMERKLPYGDLIFIIKDKQ